MNKWQSQGGGAEVGMRIFALSKHYHHTRTDGPLRHELHTNPKSRHGKTKGAQGNCLQCTSLMRQERSVPLVSMTNVMPFTRFFKRGRYIIYLSAGWTWPKGSSQMWITTTSWPSRETLRLRRCVVGILSRKFTSLTPALVSWPKRWCSPDEIQLCTSRGSKYCR